MQQPTVPAHWREVENIYLDFPGYNCVVCAPGHPWGFRLRFYHDPEEDVVVSPLAGAGEDMAGFPGVLHGGYQAMLMDEQMGWAALHQTGKIVFTARLEVKYARAVPTQTPLLVKARVLKPGSRLIAAEAWIEPWGESPGGNGECLARAEGRFFVPAVEDFLRNVGADAVPERYLSYLRG
jgi:acyl-coenzyme A thioesterase PaaI-like protein